MLMKKSKLKVEEKVSGCYACIKFQSDERDRRDYILTLLHFNVMFDIDFEFIFEEFL